MLSKCERIRAISASSVDVELARVSSGRIDEGVVPNTNAASDAATRMGVTDGRIRASR
jgi:hypothetical protein